MAPETERNGDEASKARVDSLLARAQAELAAGRAWRAKEILAGAMSDPHFAIEADVLKAYGALLDALGDRLQAGKYLFLSGTTEPEHADAIAIYLGRARKLPVKTQLLGFPGALRHQGLGHLPDSVRTYLEERGAPPSEMRRLAPRARRKADRSSEVGPVTGFGCLAIFLITLVVGAITIVRWLNQLF